MRNFEMDKLTEILFPLRLFVFNGIGKAEVRRWTKIIERENGSVRPNVTGMADYLILNPNGKSSITEYEKAKSWQRQGRRIQILDVQEFRVFMKQFAPESTQKTSRKSLAFQKIDGAEKQDVAMAYLAEADIGQYEEAAVARYIKRNKQDILKLIVTRDEDRMMAIYLKLFSRISLVDLDGMIARAKGKPAVTATLLQYKQQHYSWEQIMRADLAREEKAMGLRSLSVADWKQIYRFTVRKNGIVLTEYLSDEPHLEVPIAIGNKPVIGVLPGTFEGKPVKSINTAFMIPLKDYYGEKAVPEIYVMRTESETDNWDTVKSGQRGDTVLFGAYPQTKDGGEAPLEWVVAEKNQNEMLLLAKYPIECLPFNEGDQMTDWNRSDLRKWLNGIFLQQAFTEGEREKILFSKLDNIGNKELGIKGSKPTTDRIFLLSIEELRKYSFLTICKATDYVQEQKRKNGLKGACWWLRSPGGNHRRSATVMEDGTIRIYGEIAYNSDWMVRPALRVSLRET